MNDARPAGAQRLVATIGGVVQGVGFRWFVQREAARLDVDGWVANRADGSVEVVAEGPPGALDELEARLNEGPPGASVSALSARREPARGTVAGFTIRSGAHRGD